MPLANCDEIYRREQRSISSFSRSMLPAVLHGDHAPEFLEAILCGLEGARARLEYRAELLAGAAENGLRESHALRFVRDTAQGVEHGPQLFRRREAREILIGEPNLFERVDLRRQPSAEVVDTARESLTRLRKRLLGCAREPVRVAEFLEFLQRDAGIAGLLLQLVYALERRRPERRQSAHGDAHGKPRAAPNRLHVPAHLAAVALPVALRALQVRTELSVLGAEADRDLGDAGHLSAPRRLANARSRALDV